MTQRDADGRDPQTYAIIGAAMAVHRELGHGFLGLERAVLLNFGLPRLEYKRLVLTHLPRPSAPSASSADEGERDVPA